jgi:putative membrane protein
MIKRKVLVLCIDRDNDLFEKIKLSGPIVGREANLEAATKLVLIDPQETDANTMFEAIKTYDEISKEEHAQVVTLTGSQKLGYQADKEISRQLERVLSEFKADACIFISDGASDEEVLPIVESRVKIDSKKTVVMKQAKELEKTYFVLLEKLREPYYAQIIFGIPAFILLALVVGDYLGVGWHLLAALLGLYLLIKGFGIDYLLADLFELKVSVEKISLIAYLAALPFFIISLWLGIQAYTNATAAGADAVKASALVIRNVLVLLPWAVMLVILGRIVDLVQEHKRYEVVRQGMFLITVILLWLLFSVASDWVLADAYFQEFIITIAASILIAYGSLEVMKMLRIAIAGSMKLENKEALSEIGAYIGKIVGVDRRKGQLVIQTAFGQRVTLALDAVVNVGEKVVVRY